MRPVTPPVELRSPPASPAERARPASRIGLARGACFPGSRSPRRRSLRLSSPASARSSAAAGSASRRQGSPLLRFGLARWPRPLAWRRSATASAPAAAPRPTPASSRRCRPAAPAAPALAAITCAAVPPHELPQPITGRRRPGGDRLVVQEPLDVLRQRRSPSRTAGRRSFASAFITIQSSSPRTNRPSCSRLHLPVGRDARQRLRRAQPAARRRRLLLADHPEHLVERRLLHRLARDRRAAGQAARRGSRPARRCRPGCRRRGR